MRNDIILEPHAGLANRMRVIASGLWLGGILNKKIKLIWNPDSDLNCPFENLFEPIADLEPIDKKKKLFIVRSTAQKSMLKRFVITCVNALISNKFIVFKDAEVKNICKGEIDIIALGKNCKILYFMTCEEFGVKTDEYKRFIPKPDIQHKINEQCKQFNLRTIGVHIRRTDNEIAIQQSPTELFIQRIKEDIEKDPDINYFLSTDDAQTEYQLKTLFGDKILTFDKEYSRDSMQGVKDALVDMYCLANTTKIYGSYWSSFSDVAARINGIPIEKIKIQNNA